jgi:hypothetical protein
MAVPDTIGVGGLARYKEFPDTMMFRDDWEVTPQRPLPDANSVSSLTRPHILYLPELDPVWPNPMSCMRMRITPAADECRIHVARSRAEALLVWSHLPFVAY